MHKWVYEKAECLKNEICSKGFENLTHENLEEAYYISKILKNMVCIDKDYHIVDAMEKAEKEENMEAIVKYTDYPDRRYFDGRMSNEMRYRPFDSMYPEEYDRRDMEKRMGRDKMYYTEPTRMSNMNMQHDIREGKSGKARVKYYEHKDTADNTTKTKDLNEYMDELSADVTEMIVGMSPEHKQLLKNKMTMLMSKIQ